MGQSVTVRAKPSANPEILRFEANRSLTGMGHESYSSVDDVIRDRPVDVLAKRLLEAGGVEHIHVNSSMITVHLAGGTTGAHLTEIVANLFRFYPDASDDDAAADEAVVDEAVADEAPAEPVEPAADAPVAAE